MPSEHKMLFSTYTRARYGIIKVLEDLTIHTDPGTLKRLVEDFTHKGIYNIAFSFTPRTFPSSRLMAVLVTSRETLKRHGGGIAIIAPSEKMLDTLNILNLAHGDYFMLVDSEEELLTPEA
jgi:anti-anti-sigma regulatory factor